MDNVKYDLKVVLFRVGEKGKTSHKAINLDSFIETINKPIMKERLDNGILFGLFTHDGRSRARNGNVPHHDEVMRDPDLCNILRKITMKDGVVYGYMDLTNTPAAERFKSLWKQGCKIGVSISTELVEEEEFKIRELFGCDLTCRPEFDTQIIEANFSENDSRKIESTYGPMNFSVPVDKSEVVLLDSEMTSKVEPKVSNGDFSVRDYLRERQKKPALVLQTRINEVIRYLKLSRAIAVAKNKTFIRRYISEYIHEWILASVGNPDSDMNISLGLRLTTYCKDREALRHLQQKLRQAKTQLSGSGSLQKNTQIEMNTAFTKVLFEIYDYINSKVNQEGKKI